MRYLFTLVIAMLLLQGCGPDEFYVDDENIPDKYKIKLPGGDRKKAEKVQTGGYGDGDGEVDESYDSVEVGTNYNHFFTGCEDAFVLNETTMLVKFDRYVSDVVIRQSDEDENYVYKSDADEVNGYIVFDNLRADVVYNFSCVVKHGEYNLNPHFDAAPNQVSQKIDTEEFGKKFNNPCFNSKVDTSYYTDAGDVKSIVIDFYHDGYGDRPDLYKNGQFYEGKGSSDFEYVDQYVDYSYQEGDIYHCTQYRWGREESGVGMVHPYEAQPKVYSQEIKVEVVE